MFCYKKESVKIATHFISIYIVPTKTMRPSKMGGLPMAHLSYGQADPGRVGVMMIKVFYLGTLIRF